MGDRGSDADGRASGRRNGKRRQTTAGIRSRTLAPTPRCGFDGGVRRHAEVGGVRCAFDALTVSCRHHRRAGSASTCPRAPRAASDPFFAYLTLGVTHEGQVWPTWQLGDEPLHWLLLPMRLRSHARWQHRTDPAAVLVPPYYPDLPEVRADLARHYDNVAAMDRMVGEMLEVLARDGLADDTVVIFTTDHGDGLPRAKRWLYDSGIRVPLIVRWPGRVDPGSVSDELVSGVDLAPTLLALAGVARPPHMEGRVLLGAERESPPEVVFAARDRMDESPDTVRAARGPRFAYIRNLGPELPYQLPNAFAEQMPTRRERPCPPPRSARLRPRLPEASVAPSGGACARPSPPPRRRARSAARTWSIVEPAARARETEVSDPSSASPSPYTPPRVWKWDTKSGGRFARINRPIAGPTHEKELPVGEHPLQLYSLATPNGVKVTVLLEELLALGRKGAEYDAWLVNIGEGGQFGSGFVAINPNSKIPALLDRSAAPPIRVFESGAILVYLAEKFGAFLPTQPAARAECLSWLFWQMGSAPYLGGGFGHFYAYAPEKYEYPINRYAMEVKRQLDVLDRNLAERRYLCGDEYTIADIATYPWYGGLVMGRLYDAAEFLDVASYRHVVRWATEIAGRDAVGRGERVNKTWGPEALRVPERHGAADLG